MVLSTYLSDKFLQEIENQLSEQESGLSSIIPQQITVLDLPSYCNYESQIIRNKAKPGIINYSNAVYEGDVVFNQRQGFGVMKYECGRVYTGEWVRDLRHGKGVEKWG